MGLWNQVESNEDARGRWRISICPACFWLPNGSFSLDLKRKRESFGPQNDTEDLMKLIQ